MLLLRLYPRAWRDRYEAEMEALLEQHDVTIATVLDLLWGAGDAWLDQRRAPVKPSTSAVWRGARLGLLPSAFNLLQFLLALDLRIDVTLLNLAGLLSAPAIPLACLCAGYLEARRGSPWRQRLLAGATAGAVGVIASMLVENGLGLADAGLRLTNFVNHPHALVLDTAAMGAMAANLASARVLVYSGVVILVALALGVGMGALGSALTRLRRLLPI